MLKEYVSGISDELIPWHEVQDFKLSPGEPEYPDGEPAELVNEFEVLKKTINRPKLKKRYESCFINLSKKFLLRKNDK